MSNEFVEFRNVINVQISKMEKTTLYKAGIDGQIIYDLYLDSFREGDNNMFRERREYDCSCCKQFIRNVGGVITIVDNKIVTIWDIIASYKFQPVVDALASYVRSQGIVGLYSNDSQAVGCKQNVDTGNITWDHLHYKFKSNVTDVRDIRENVDMLIRASEEITVDSITMVIDRIDSGDIYRGIEHLETLKSFLIIKMDYDKLRASPDTMSFQDTAIWAWRNAEKYGGLCRIRNSMIGTLLTDISKGIDIEDAIPMFETKAYSYKRPKAIISKAMIAKAQKFATECDFIESLPRRHATIEDISANDVLWVNRNTKNKLIQDDMFDQLSSKVVSHKKDTCIDNSKAKTVTMSDFLELELPKCSKVELLVENRMRNRTVSLTAPININSKRIFKWDNNFAWTYAGGNADSSIRQQVSDKGGNVDGLLRVSLSWYNTDDLDIHVKLGNDHVYYGHQRSFCCNLDVDMNVNNPVRNAVENLTWDDNIKPGEHQVFVENYTKRENTMVGFIVEMEYNDILTQFKYDKEIGNKEQVNVLRFTHSDTTGIEIIKSIPFEIINTSEFKEVSSITHSPNYWGENNTGNLHTFFFMDDHKQEGRIRGYYNEFLKDEFAEHRKVFESLAADMTIPYSDRQLSGIGFSSTQKETFVVRITSSDGTKKKVLNIQNGA